MSMTAFLAKVFRGEMDCVLGYMAWLKENYAGIRFLPDRR